MKKVCMCKYRCTLVRRIVIESEQILILRGLIWD